MYRDIGETTVALRSRRDCGEQGVAGLLKGPERSQAFKVSAAEQDGNDKRKRESRAPL